MRELKGSVPYGKVLHDAEICIEKQLFIALSAIDAAFAADERVDDEDDNEDDDNDDFWIDQQSIAFKVFGE